MKEIKLKEYSFGKVIGEGSFSKVKIGQYIPTKQTVAIKIIDKEKMRAMEADKEQLKREIEMERNRIENHPDLQVTENARKQHQKYDYKAIFQEEILLLMRFDHPNVIKTYKVIDTVDEAYIIMEYAPGGELLDYVVSKKYLQETEARKLFRQLVSAMDYIHESGVVHRDLKLENILLNEAGSILVSDFGLGRTFYPEQKLSTFCGTPTHAAPEMVTGQRYNGVKTDIWAMGVVLYVMVTGFLPFQGDNIIELFTNIKRGNYATPYYLSTGQIALILDLKDLLALIFVTNPNRRVTMEGLRDHPWVNLDFSSPPKRYPLKHFPNSDVGSAITSITVEGEYTIYNVNDFESELFEKAVETFGQLQRKHNSSASSILMRRRKSITPSDSHRKGINIYAEKSIDSAPGMFSGGAIAIQEGSKPTGGANPNISNQLLSPVLISRARAKTISAIPAVEPLHTSSTAETQGAIQNNILSEVKIDSPKAMDTMEIKKEFAASSKEIARHKRNASYSPNAKNANEESFTNEFSREESILERLSVVGPIEIPISKSLTIGTIPESEISFGEIEQWHMIHLPPKKIRTMRFNLKRGLHSTLGPVLMFQDLHKALVKIKTNPNMKLSFQRVPDFYMFLVSIIGRNPEESLQLELEVCKVWLLKIHAVRAKKLLGKSQAYKNFINNLILLLEWI